MQYRAPSFSWAANDGQIEFPELQYDDYVLAPEIMDVHLHYETEDVFGAITGGHLTVRSYFYRVSFLPTQQKPGHVRSRPVQILSPHGYDGDGAFLESVVHQNDIRCVFMDNEPDSIDPSFEESLYCIPRHQRYGRFDLLILQLVDRKKAHYARRGLIEIHDPEEDEPGSVLEKLQTAPCDPSLHYPCIAYDGGKHTICLV